MGIEFLLIQGLFTHTGLRTVSTPPSRNKIIEADRNGRKLRSIRLGKKHLLLIQCIHLSENN